MRAFVEPRSMRATGRVDPNLIKAVVVVSMLLVGCGGYYLYTSVLPQIRIETEKREVLDAIREDGASADLLLISTPIEDAAKIRASAKRDAVQHVSGLKLFSQMGRSAWVGLCSWGWKAPHHEAEMVGIVTLYKIDADVNPYHGRPLTTDEQTAWRRLFAVEMLKEYQRERGWLKE